MAWSQGYRNYRGRTSKAKVAAAILLVLVILAAVVVILLQRNIVYDETGTPHLELPWETEEPAPELPEGGELDLTIESPEELPAEESHILRAYAVPEGVLTADSWETIQAVMQIAQPPYDAVAVTLKDDSGKVYFDAESAVSGAVKTEADTETVLAEILEGYAIARISCFHDPRAANSNVESMGLKNTGGYIFYDGNNSQWMDPAKEEARAYLRNLVREAAELGFDEILLTDVHYPLEGKLDKIAYGDVNRQETLRSFLRELRVLLEPYSVAVSIEVPEEVVAAGRSDAAGWTLSGAASEVDFIYAAADRETAGRYEQAVEAAGSAAFVPVLRENSELADGSCLILN